MPYSPFRFLTPSPLWGTPPYEGGELITPPLAKRGCHEVTGALETSEGVSRSDGGVNLILHPDA